MSRAVRSTRGQATRGQATRGPASPALRYAGLGLLGGLLCGLPGCHASRTPEAACEKLLQAIAEGDPSSVFEALLQTTQASFYSVAKNHRKMRELIRDSYPAAQQAAALGRLYAAEAGSGRDLFVGLYAQRYEQDFNRRLGTGPMHLTAQEPGPGGLPRQLCARKSGQPFLLQATATGKWGMAELDREWDEAQLRTFHDLATVQKNAELYRGVQPAPAPVSQPASK